MLISRNDNWFCLMLDIDNYMNLFYYIQNTNEYRFYESNFGYQNMFITLEIRNCMYREDY